MSELASEFADLRPELEQGLVTLGERAQAHQADALLMYLTMLSNWSRAYNLTAIREPRAMLVQHVLDCVSVLRFVRGPRVLDIGSGAGLPGFVIAILRPDLHVTLVDSVAKKTTFCRQVCAHLRIGNVEPMHTRIEKLDVGTGFDTIVARAFASLGKLNACATRALAPGGTIVAMKGKQSDAELDELRAGRVLVDVKTVFVPQLDAHRHIVLMQPPEQVSA